MKRQPRIYYNRLISSSDVITDDVVALGKYIQERATVVNGHHLQDVPSLRLEQESWRTEEFRVGGSGSITTRDERLIDIADTLIGIAGNSWGMGYETAYALHAGKRVLAFVPPPFGSLMLRENQHPSLTTVAYQGLVHAQEFVAGYLRDIYSSFDTGLFVSFEGIEGSGKSTQIRQLQTWLGERGLVVHSVREPGGTRLGEEMRHVLLNNRNTEIRSALAELFIFLVARTELSFEFIRPALARGEIVLADRCADSSRAYQGGGRYNHRPDIVGQINHLNSYALEGRWPDLTFLLRIPVEMSMERIRGRELDTMEREARAFHQRVADEYDLIARENPYRVVTIDGTKTPDVIFKEDIQPRIEELLKGCLRK
jgi:dTMP kinase